MHTVLRLFSPLKEMKKITFLSFFVILNWHLFDLVTVIVTKEIGDLVETSNVTHMELILYAYGGFFILHYVIKYATRNRAVIRIRYTANKILRKKIYKQYFALDITATEKLGTGKIIDILSKGVQSRIDIIRLTLFNISKILVQLFMIGYLLYQLGLIYTLIFIVILLFLVWLINRIYENKVVHRRRKKKNLIVRNSGYMVRMIMSKIEILQINRINTEIDRYIDLVKQQETIAYKNMKWVFLMFNSSLILMHAFLPLIILYAIISINSGTFSFGLFAGLSVAGGTLGGFMLSVTGSYQQIIDHFIDVEKLRNFLDTTPRMKGYDSGKDFSYINGTVTLNNVTFAYDTTNNHRDQIFSDFSLTIPGNQKTALVGVSGSGKSTLIKLITGYLRPDQGIVSVDGQDLAKTSLKSYFSNIGYLTQDPGVFDGSILDNLTYALDNAISDKALKEYISLAQCDFIWDFPDGLETQIGERGIRLSGGQRQRLAIAKIFIKNPKIVLLDEPTSALDSFSEESIRQAMQNLFTGRTVIIIAHRLQTVKYADDIIVLDNGKVIERGTHNNLLKQGGSYAKMLELQSGF